MTEDTEADAYDPFDDDAVFRPFSVDDYFDRRVRTDHAPNAALHDALQAANDTYDDPVVYNLMASHAPHGAERRAKGEPRYHVRASITNAGMGTASIYDTPIGKLVERGDAVVTHAESSSVFDEPVDREGHADELTVHVRPVTNRTRPVEVPYSDLPDDVFEFHTIRFNAQKVLSHAIDEVGSNRETYEAARCLSTLLALIDPEATDRSIGDRFAEDTIRWLSDKAGAEWEFVEVNDTTTVHFPDEDVDAPDVDHDVDDRFARIRATVGGDEYTDVVREKEKMPDLPPDVDVYVDRVEAVDGTTIPCGCGEYAVEVPERALPVTIDVECPECGNHFGHGSAADGIASGLGFAMLGEWVDRHGDGDPVPVEDFVDAFDEDRLERAVDIGVIEYREGDDTVVDARDRLDQRVEGLDGFVPYTRRLAEKPDVHVAVQDVDTGEVVRSVNAKAGTWEKVDTGRGIYNVRVDVGSATPASSFVTAYECHACDRRSLPSQFHADDGPRCPYCGEPVDWDRGEGDDAEGPYRAVNEARDAAIDGGYFEPECPTCDYGPLNLNGSASWYKCPSCGDTGKTSTIEGWSTFDALTDPVLRDAYDDGLIDPSMFDVGVAGLGDYLDARGRSRGEDLGAPYRRAAEAAYRIVDEDREGGSNE